MKRDLNVLVVINTEDENFLDNNKNVSIIPECIPSGSNNTDIFYLCTKRPEVLSQYLQDCEIHFIVSLTLGDEPLTLNDTFMDVPILSITEGFKELFGNKAVGRKLIAEKIKPEFLKVDYKLAWPKNVKIAKTREDLEYLKDKAFKVPIGLDTETNHLNSFLRKPEPFLVCFSIAFMDDMEECWAVPTSDNLIKDAECEFTKEEALKCAEDIFFESPQPQSWQNAHYDLIVLWELFGGRKPKNFFCDSMLLLSIYHKAMKSCSLANNVTMVGLPEYKDAAKEWLKQNQSRAKGARKLDFSDVPADIICPYAAIDALAVVRIVKFMQKNLTKEQWRFYFNIAHEILLTSIELCIEGYEISQDRFNYAKLEVEKHIKSSFDWVMEMADKHVDKETFNVNSNDHLGELLFEKLQLPIMSKTKGGKPAVGASALDNLILFHPIVFAITKLKKTVKLYSSYIKSYSSSLGSGTRHQKYTDKRFVLNPQLKQTNRTARLSSTNMAGWDGSSKKGGSLLTLPASGSLIKSFFEPDQVVEKENLLYDAILNTLKEQDPEEYERVMNNLSYDATTLLKPKTVVKKPKKKVENE